MMRCPSDAVPRRDPNPKSWDYEHSLLHNSRLYCRLYMSKEMLSTRGISMYQFSALKISRLSSKMYASFRTD